VNNDELDGILKAAKEPGRTSEYWEQFPRSVRVQLRRGQGAIAPSVQRGFHRGWMIAPALACLVIVVLVAHWRGRPGREMANSFLQNRKDVQGMLAMFPNQVRAIVQDGRGVNLVLSDRQDVPDSPPLYIHFCDGKQCSTVITFSGQEVQIAGRKITALSDAKGGVILVGDRFLWSNEEPQRPTGALRIEARELVSAGAS
jgi:hypothetical protein